jgi:argininosuccinate lyase
MEKLWAGRFSTAAAEIADDFNSSIGFDQRMYREDIMGSMAHADMLAGQGIITEEEKLNIKSGLEKILSGIESGEIEIDPGAEDIHMFVEALLTKMIGDDGKKLHTARSRNDQVALDTKLYIKNEIPKVIDLIKDLMESVLEVAKENTDAIMPGYTHLQRAQPVLFAHHLLAYEMMFKRDIGRLEDALIRADESPIGACALAGTTYNTDRRREAELLGFADITKNSMDSVSDRDFSLEIMSAFSILMMHLSRFSEEIILWSSWEFKFIELDDAFSTGSSIMPQKKNPDMAELVRGKTGRVYGDMISLFTVLKGLPLAYNKDMQEDKEPLFDSIDTVKNCLRVFSPMIKTMKVLKGNMLSAAQRGFINATDLADYLVKKGLPFRSAYKIVGEIVRECIEKNKVLETLTLSEYQAHSELFSEDLFGEISLETCIEKRISEGSTGKESVNKQINYITNYLKGEN